MSDTETTETTETAPVEQATFEVPADLTALDDTSLTELAANVHARGAELATQSATAQLSADEVTEAEDLGSVYDEIQAVIAGRAAEAAALSNRAASVLSRFATATETDTPTEPADPEDPDDPDEPAEPAEATTTEGSDAEEQQAVTASAPRRPTSFRGASPARVRSKAKNVQDPKIGEPGEFMVATAFAKDPEGTQFASSADVAKALWKKRMAFGNIPAGTNEMLSIATGTKTFEEGSPMLGLDPQANLISLQAVNDALVASGTFCTPQTQLYNFFRLAQPIRDVEDAINTVQAPRGGIRYIAANCNVAGAAAVGRYTYDPETPGGPDSEDVDFEKPCDRVSCPTVDEVLVEAITQCTVFDNLQYRTFPELIENFMEDVAVQFTLRKQRFYLDHIDANSTATTGIGSYGAARSLFYDWTVAAQAYRKRHHMPRGSSLELFAPDWALDVVKADMFNDGDSGLDYLNVPDSAVEEGLRSRDLNVTWYFDDPTSLTGQNPLTGAQAGAKANLHDYPAEVVSFMHAPGTFVKLDGGTLDLGLVRDHSLNRSNDFAMFMEEWIGFAMLGCESVRIDSRVCPSGSRAPYAGALRTCAAPVS